jgi:Ca2+-binding RTX toxin-like protein
LIGERDVDVITGDEGDDKVDGGKGEDHLDGSEGNDEINGGEGSDIMVGGLGSDTFICDEFDKIMDFSSVEGDKKIGSCLVIDYNKANTTQLTRNTTIQ